MRTHDSHATIRLCRAPLALCLGAALALGTTPGTATAASPGTPFHRLGGGPLLAGLAERAPSVRRMHHDTPHPDGGLVIPVTSCADDGSDGTLRHAALVAASGDTLDLSALTCSTITLESGAINVDVADLDIIGPGASELTIDGADADRVIRHGGSGEIDISGVTLAHGHYTAPSLPMAYGGGCLYSQGTVSLSGVVVTSCTATGPYVVAGGGILAFNGAILFYSTVSDSSAISTTGVETSTSAVGGGVVSAAQLVIEHSTISGNLATTALGNAYAGGAFGSGSVLVKYSTFSDNAVTTGNVEGSMHYGIGGALAASAPFVQNSTFDNNSADAGAGVYLLSGSAPATFRNSTISGNHAAVLAGAALSNGDITLHNSTIAFNDSGFRGGGGLFVNGSSAEIVSSIIANNTPSGPEAAADLDGSAAVTGSNNLIKVSGIPVPPDTITLDPQLGSLAWNGGETRTHALPSTSPAHDTGLNANNFDYDQRGTGYPRVDATDPDIGAYELDPDIIFVDGFGN